MQRDMLERQGRHGRNGTPVAHRGRRLTAPLAHPPIRRDGFELVREDVESQRLEVGAGAFANERQNAVVSRVNDRCPSGSDYRTASTAFASRTPSEPPELAQGFVHHD